jgi:putative hydrolase of the HAD superfamily
VKRKISTLIFDLGGVLTKPQDPARVRDMLEILGLDGPEGPDHALERFKKVYFAYRDEYDRGTLGVEDYWQTVCSELGLAYPASRLPELIVADHDAWFRYRPAIFEALPGLRSRLRKMAVLSNMNWEGANRVRHTLPKIELFDHLCLSCELKLMKPEAAIFESCLASLGSEPGACLFVDDSQVNVEGARAAGLYSFRFVEEEQFFAEIDTFYEFVRS